MFSVSVLAGLPIVSATRQFEIVKSPPSPSSPVTSSSIQWELGLVEMSESKSSTINYCCSKSICCCSSHRKCFDWWSVEQYQSPRSLLASLVFSILSSFHLGGGTPTSVDPHRSFPIRRRKCCQL
ncbi:hypothetical protein AVEN_95210-1 [Araneus ventricosus]|uniref:Uncharacterized protein n=1 Tax=Araneus ventricosus TaxID=182803 RepID=A0A4Y2WA90_ARAVE|nr:hypothetical protein AVEN_95210-1 [Araneus ventricosus]